jgi:hypothetical protein
MAGASTSMATSLFVRAVGRGVDAGALLSDRHLVRADGAPESDDRPRQQARIGGVQQLIPAVSGPWSGGLATGRQKKNREHGRACARRHATIN